MDVNRFDQRARQLSPGNRRTFGRTLGWLALFGGGPFAFPPLEGEAKRKGKGKKRKCKGGTKKCGKKCIPATQCCPPLGCGMGAECISGTCQCVTGWKPCGATCIQEHSCCTDADCVDTTWGHTCIEHTCKCLGVQGNLTCCEPGEIYNYTHRRCEPGSCPNDPVCDGGLTDTYLCGKPASGFGVCGRSANNRSVCFDDINIVCTTCSTDSDCVTLLGSGAICINPGGCLCGFTTTGFCARTVPH